MLPNFPETLATAECRGVGCEYFSVTIFVQYESISADVGGSFNASGCSSPVSAGGRKAGVPKLLVGTGGGVESSRRVDANGVDK